MLVVSGCGARPFDDGPELYAGDFADGQNFVIDHDGTFKGRSAYSAGSNLCLTGPGTATITGYRWRLSQGLTISQLGLDPPIPTPGPDESPRRTLQSMGMETEHLVTTQECSKDPRRWIGIEIRSTDRHRNAYGQDLQIDDVVDGRHKQLVIPVGASMCADGVPSGPRRPSRSRDDWD